MNAKTDGEREECQPHGVEHAGHPQLAEIGHQEVTHPLHRIGQGKAKGDQHQDHQEQGGHHPAQGAFHPLLNAPLHHHPGEGGKQQVGEDGPDIPADIVIEAGGEGRRITMVEIAGDGHPGITERPAAHHAVEAVDEQGRDHPHYPNPAPLFAEQFGEGTHYPAAAHAAEQGLPHQYRHPQREAEQQKDQQEGAAAVDGGDVGEFPDCADTDCGTRSGEDVAESG